MYEKVLKGLIIVVVGLYWISPVDLIPGVPIDDIIVTVMGVIVNYKIRSKKRIAAKQ